jgi:hypothetical protein
LVLAGDRRPTTDGGVEGIHEILNEQQHGRKIPCLWLAWCLKISQVFAELFVGWRSLAVRIHPSSITKSTPGTRPG